MTPNEFGAVVEGWNWRARQDRIRTYESGYLHHIKRMPSLDHWLDPPRTRRISKTEAAERRAGFEAAKAASDRVPVRSSRKPQPRSR